MVCAVYLINLYIVINIRFYRDKGLTLKPSALEYLYSRQITFKLSTLLNETYFVFTPLVVSLETNLLSICILFIVRLPY